MFKSVTNRLMRLAQDMNPFEFNALSKEEKRAMASDPLKLCMDTFEYLSREENIEDILEYGPRLLDIATDISKYLNKYKAFTITCTTKTIGILTKSLFEKEMDSNEQDG